MSTHVTHVAFGADAPKLGNIVAAFVAATVAATFVIMFEHKHVDAGSTVQTRPTVTRVIFSRL